MYSCDFAEDERVADKRPEEVDRVHQNMPWRRSPHNSRVVCLAQPHQDASLARALLLKPRQHSAQHTGAHLWAVHTVFRDALACELQRSDRTMQPAAVCG